VALFAAADEAVSPSASSVSRAKRFVRNVRQERASSVAPPALIKGSGMRPWQAPASQGIPGNPRGYPRGIPGGFHGITEVPGNVQGDSRESQGVSRESSRGFPRESWDLGNPRGIPGESLGISREFPGNPLAFPGIPLGFPRFPDTLGNSLEDSLEIPCDSLEFPWTFPGTSVIPWNPPWDFLEFRDSPVPGPWDPAGGGRVPLPARRRWAWSSFLRAPFPAAGTAARHRTAGGVRSFAPSREMAWPCRLRVPA